MKLISYTGTRPGIQGVGSFAVRLGTNSLYSHTEIMFEPGDGVDHLMPDNNLQPGDNGALWCASSSAGDRMPAWSTKRAGKLGGVRFKRIVLKPEHWFIQDLPRDIFDPHATAQWFVVNQGLAYDYRHIASFVSAPMNLIFSHGVDHYTCTECTAAALGFAQSERFHPGNFPPVIERIGLIG